MRPEPTEHPERTAAQRLYQYNVDLKVAFVLYAVAKLHLPDLLADGPRTTADLAAATGSDPSRLRRLLRAAAGADALREVPEDSFELAPMGDLLRSGHPRSMRGMTTFFAEPDVLAAYGDLVESVRTGVPAFQLRHREPLYDFLARPQHKEVRDEFDAAMVEFGQYFADDFLTSFDFGRFTRFADIGGGRGQFLAGVLTAVPSSTGVLVDGPAVAASAHKFLASQNLTERVEVRIGDFFDVLPTGCDAYVLRGVLEDWADADAVRLLVRIRQAMGDAPEARLLILDSVIGETGELGKVLDLDMLVLVEGEHRTRAQWDDLLARAGFDIVGIHPAGDVWAVIECRGTAG
ncbi:SAM-dependent methyltransferases [Streptomyces davaonensis JCM 4913]|uniref:8-amino-8-demethylriboflavin N,N-dimethyltransferase n=2 Tax=Streptomyces davaonensis (strain DSM 101723 / JCM 4913 / KCC S-0913 / 768) TaxID=1214101 RepID=ROSA_STRDJ|nr:N,N-8-amino-8-demethyl-D-riboflavin dimethyltransferase RosA [Streptomyces davaonensis]K4RFM2.1 RecName: Full=8-amino-8-demethylriboflavin N,N-dimethyltransferase; AltName: Full=AF dimethyltransferase; AltName: Full=N,N-8-amino-8-demethyl-D-riboflavin dimethyltransferase [Streptomyces davaonensis JCM 4913]QDM39062.1 8-demethyl-8-aminoriboflavin-5'-phosphate synthase RosB [synthetic construct]CBY84436.1 N,N-8-amino-8-demethyl-D-riboflavin dimethyltransferase [Streptomyces davaonensis JCM 4913]